MGPVIGAVRTEPGGAEGNRTAVRIKKGPEHKEFGRAVIEKREPRFNEA